MVLELLNNKNLRQLKGDPCLNVHEERLQLLKETLKGIQRVPTLLLNNPIKTLTQVHLEGYTILDCEPLHDIKGHIDNLLQELPHILETELSNEVEELLQVDLWSKKTKRLQASNYSCIKLVKRMTNNQKYFNWWKQVICHAYYNRRKPTDLLKQY